MKEFYTKYAEIALKLGVNLQIDQQLEIICPTFLEDFGLILAETAYKLDASKVHITWVNEKAERLNYIYMSKKDLSYVPTWLIEQKNSLVRENACYLVVDADDPNAFKGVSEPKIATYQKAKSKALKEYSDAVMSNQIRWCVIASPSKEWANLVYDNDENAFYKLKDAIEKSMRLNADNPMTEWIKHIKDLSSKTKFLNEMNFESLHFESKNGTDLTVGLADGHIWTSAMEKAKDGIEFIANMPTEEVFTAPHSHKVNGVVKNALPLSLNGKIIDDFSFTFVDGKIVEFSAKKGYETLSELLKTDDGILRLGEVALIGKNSPIAKMNTLFYNTLFDENASCHLALGAGYPTTVKNADNMSPDEKKKVGLNDSIEHVDFMIGTNDLTVTGIKFNGEKVKIFNNGEWCV